MRINYGNAQFSRWERALWPFLDLTAYVIHPTLIVKR
jgi:hypothetical protein